MKKNVLLLFLFSLAIIGCQNYDSEFDSLSEEINAISTASNAGLSALGTQISNLENTVNTVQTTFEDSVTSLTSQLTSVEMELEAMQSSQSMTESELNSLQDLQTTLLESIAEAQSDLAALQSASSEITTLQSELAALQAMQIASPNSTAIQSDIATVQAALSELESNVSNILENDPQTVADSSFRAINQPVVITTIEELEAAENLFSSSKNASNVIVNGGLELNLSTTNFTPAHIDRVNQIAAQIAHVRGGGITINNDHTTNVNMKNLVTIQGSGNFSGAILSAENLVSVSGNLILDYDSGSVNLNSLTTIGGNLEAKDLVKNASFSANRLTSISGTIEITGSNEINLEALTTLSKNATLTAFSVNLDALTSFSDAVTAVITGATALNLSNLSLNESVNELQIPSATSLIIGSVGSLGNYTVTNASNLQNLTITALGSDKYISISNLPALRTIDIIGENIDPALPMASLSNHVFIEHPTVTSVSVGGSINQLNIVNTPALTSLSTTGRLSAFSLQNANSLENATLGHKHNLVSNALVPSISVDGNTKLKSIKTTNLELVGTIEIVQNPALSQIDLSSVTQAPASGDYFISIQNNNLRGNFTSARPAIQNMPFQQAVIGSSDLFSLNGLINAYNNPSNESKLISLQLNVKEVVINGDQSDTSSLAEVLGEDSYLITEGNPSIAEFGGSTGITDPSQYVLFAGTINSTNNVINQHVTISTPAQLEAAESIFLVAKNSNLFTVNGNLTLDLTNSSFDLTHIDRVNEILNRIGSVGASNTLTINNLFTAALTLDNLSSVTGSITFSGTPIVLNNLTSVTGNVILSHNPGSVDLGNISTIGGNLVAKNLSKNAVFTANNLVLVNGTIEITGASEINLGNLLTLRKNATLSASSINLDALQSFSDNVVAVIDDATTVSLPKLKLKGQLNELQIPSATSLTLVSADNQSNNTISNASNLQHLTITALGNTEYFTTAGFSALRTVNVTGASGASSLSNNVFIGNPNVTSISVGGVLETLNIQNTPALTSLTTSGRIGAFALQDATSIENVSLGHRHNVVNGSLISSLQFMRNTKLKSIKTTNLELLGNIEIVQNPALSQIDLSSVTQAPASGGYIIAIQNNDLRGNFTSARPAIQNMPFQQAVIGSSDLFSLDGLINAYSNPSNGSNLLSLQLNINEVIINGDPSDTESLGSVLGQDSYLITQGDPSIAAFGSSLGITDPSQYVLFAGTINSTNNVINQHVTISTPAELAAAESLFLVAKNSDFFTVNGNLTLDLTNSSFDLTHIDRVNEILNRIGSVGASNTLTINNLFTAALTLDNLSSVTGSITFSGTPIVLNNLTSVTGNVILNHNPGSVDLGNISTIGGNLVAKNLSKNAVFTANNLVLVNGTIEITGASEINLGNLLTLRKNATLSASSINLDALQSFSDNVVAVIDDATTVSLPKLKLKGQLNELQIPSATSLTIASADNQSNNTISNASNLQYLTITALGNTDYFTTASYSALRTVNVTGASGASSLSNHVFIGNANVTSISVGGLINTLNIENTSALTSLTTSGRIGAFTLQNATSIENVTLGHRHSLVSGALTSSLELDGNTKLKSLKTTNLELLGDIIIVRNPALSEIDLSSVTQAPASGFHSISIENNNLSAILAVALPGSSQAVITSSDLFSLKSLMNSYSNNSNNVALSLSINVNNVTLFGGPAGQSLGALLQEDSQFITEHDPSFPAFTSQAITDPAQFELVVNN